MKFARIKLFNVPYSQTSRHQPKYSKMPLYTSDTNTEWKPIITFINPELELQPGTDEHVTAKSLTCKFESVFNEIENLPVEYKKVRICNYILLEWWYAGDKTNPEIKDIYGWITDIKITGDTKRDDGTFINLVKITYTVDYWRTEIENVKPVRGLIRQRPASIYTDDPIQPVNYDYRISSAVEFKLPDQFDDVAWPIVSYITKDDPPIIKRVTFPVNTKNFQEQKHFYNKERGDVGGPPLAKLLDGSFITKLGISEHQLLSVQISPICPLNVVSYENNIFEFQWGKNEDYLTYRLDMRENLIANYPDDNIKKHFVAINGEKISVDQWDPNYLVTFLTKYYNTPTTYVYELALVRKYYFYGNIHDNGKYHGLPFFIMSFKMPNWDRIWKIEVESGVLYVDTETKWRFEQYGLDVSFYAKDNQPSRLFLKAERYDDNPEHWSVTYRTLIGIQDTKNFTIYDIISLTNDEIVFKLYFDSLEEYKLENVLISNETKEIVNGKEKVNAAIYYNYLVNYSGFWPTKTHDFGVDLRGNETVDMVLAGWDGMPLKTFPKKMSLRFVSYEVLTTPQKSYLLLRWGDVHHYINSMEVAIPFTNVEVAQSYLNEYILSGERDADNMRRNAAIVESFISAAVSLTGAHIIDNYGKKEPEKLGSLFTKGGLLTSGISSGLQGVMGFVNQGMNENIMKSKGSALIRSGDDYTWIKNGMHLSIVSLRVDDYHRDLYFDTVNEYGINVAEPKDGEFIKMLIEKGGPLRIEDLLITGDLDAVAKDYITMRLSNGVYIDENLSAVPNEKK